MKIISLKTYGLRGGNDINTDFYDDINIITGRNGSGKTTALKLAWLIISGNLSLALNEIIFRKILLKTSLYSLSIDRRHDGKILSLEINGEEGINIKYKMISSSETVNKNLLFWEHNQEEEEANTLNSAAEFLSHCGSSIFFPTFRRIEGGFSMTSTRIGSSIYRRRSGSEVEEALNSLSAKLSKEEHRFITSLSTYDVVQLLLQKYANCTDQATTIQNKMSQEIIDSIKKYEDKEKSSTHDTREEIRLIKSVKSKIEHIEKKREEIMKPIETVQSVVKQIFQHSGINIGGSLNFGDAANAINSDQMSAGEKQLLSFICYNAFYKNSVFIIDEPELSLHVDWQRTFFNILKKQNSSNQFIVATHSPFIYSKYPDREITLNTDRGDNS